MDSDTCPRQKLRQLAQVGVGVGRGGCSCLEAWKEASCLLAPGEGGENPWNKPVFQLPSQWGSLSKMQQLHQQLGMGGVDGREGRFWLKRESPGWGGGQPHTLGTRDDEPWQTCAVCPLGAWVLGSSPIKRRPWSNGS